MAEVPFRPVRQLSEYKGKEASASREFCQLYRKKMETSSSLLHLLHLPFILLNLGHFTMYFVRHGLMMVTLVVFM